MGTAYDIYKTYFKYDKYSAEKLINDDFEKLIKIKDDPGMHFLYL